MPPEQQGHDGAERHYRALEQLYASAPINQKFSSQLLIEGEGRCSLTFQIDESSFHAAGAAHGTIYFNTLATDRFLLTTSFNLHFTKPVRAGEVTAEGRWISGKRRVFVAESRLIDAEGDEIGRGTGTFLRSRIALSSLDGYIKGRG